MANVADVFARLEEMLDSGQSAEEVCREYPELLPEVRRRWKDFCRIDAQVEALLPEPATHFVGEAVATGPSAGSLPQIPGYEVEAILGRGGMGVVYKARQCTLDRFVAIKMLLAGPFAGPHDLGRFRRETAALACLRHPNIVQVHDAGDVDGRPYFAMELVAGGSLTEKLLGEPQPAREAAALVATLAKAVHVAHTNGIVHRDLKPANVLLADDGTPKITDFGLARSVEGGAEFTLSGVPVGTPSYMAPEQARGQRRAIGPACDVYALGAMLYELLTGRLPFAGETAQETLFQVVNQEPLPPTRLNPRAPRDLETICLKCLQKDPGKRYPSAAGLAADLGRFLRHEPVQARPTGRVEYFVRWMRRRPAVAGLLIAVVLLVLTGGVWAWQLYEQRAAAQGRQAMTDEEILQAVERGGALLEEGWQAQDLSRLTEAEAEGRRAEHAAQSRAASVTVREKVEAFRVDAEARLNRGKKNVALREAVLDVATPEEVIRFSRDEAGRMAVSAQPSVDEQYAAAFRRWGLDVDGTPESEVLARLGAEPDAMVPELIAALDGWMLERRRRKRPEAEWRRLFRVAEQLDRSARHRWLRTLLVGEAPPRPASVAVLCVAGSCVPELSLPALWQLVRGDAWQQLRELRKEIDLRTAPAPTLILLAKAYATLGDAAGAEQLLREAAAARPGQVGLLTALGQLCEQQGRLGQATEYYRAARGQRPHLGLALSSALTQVGRADEAEQILMELLRDQPEDAKLYNYLGAALGTQDKLDAAEAAFRKGIDLQPDSARLHNNLGICLARQRQYAAAEAAYRKAIELRPKFFDAFFNLGLALRDQKKFADMEAAIRTSIDLQSNSADAYEQFGIALAGQGKDKAAEAAYLKAIELQPDAQTYVELGLVLSKQKNLEAGEAAFRQAIKLAPHRAVAHYNLGTNLTNQGRHDAAETAFRVAIGRQPDLAQAHHGLGLALLQQGQFDEALVCVKKARDLLPATDPTREQTLPLLGHCERFAALNSRLPAILRREEKPTDAAEQIDLARVCTLKKLHATAARFYRDAFSAEPKSAGTAPAGVRYQAACAAALAGCTKGLDADQLDDKERAHWRQQALEWLRHDLAWWSKQLDDADARIKAGVRYRVHQWQLTPTLAGVRGKDGLARLPEEERRQWASLWSDVDALVRRSNAPE